MTSHSLPDSLREAIGNDLQPVRPLPPVWMRTLFAVAVAAVCLGVVVVVFKLSLRPDMDQIPMWLSWGCTLIQLTIGVVLLGMALREAVPGHGVPAGMVATAVGTGILMQILVGIATWMHSPGMPYVPGQGLKTGIGCASHDTALALPALVVTLWLVFRALPLRPSVAGSAWRHGRSCDRRRPHPYSLPHVGSSTRPGVAHRSDLRSDAGRVGAGKLWDEQAVARNRSNV